jgi:uncharacterized lipoprotein YddW (UPF0748 family)
MRIACLSLVLAGTAFAAPSRAAEVRALWVTRFEYRTEADVRTILRNSAALGFNTVLFQVRGQADAYYRSEIEPWADRLGGRDPGFDPLDVACREAKRLGIALHAWVNVMPAWRGKTPPVDRGHVALRRPEWIVVDRQGKRQPFNDHYVVLNPCLPEVREYLASVAGDIAARYPVDGVHLDYIRFIEGDWSYDKKTLALFRAKTGVFPSRDPQAWDEFRREAVTETVRMIRRAVKVARPEATLSAAVFSTAKGRRERFQDAEGWARQGLVDWVMPMTYEDGGAAFEALVSDAERAFRGAAVLPGVGAYKHESAEQTLRQLRAARNGFALFSYSSLYVSPDETRRENELLCRARREAVKSLLAR